MFKKDTVYQYKYGFYYICLGVRDILLNSYSAILSDCSFIMSQAYVKSAKDLIDKVIKRDMYAVMLKYGTELPDLTQPYIVDSDCICYMFYNQAENFNEIPIDTKEVKKWIVKNCMINEAFSNMYNRFSLLNYEEAYHSWEEQLDKQFPDFFDFYYRVTKKVFKEKKADKVLPYHLYSYFVGNYQLFALGLPRNFVLDIGMITPSVLNDVFQDKKRIAQFPMSSLARGDFYDTGIKCRFVKDYSNV